MNLEDRVLKLEKQMESLQKALNPPIKDIVFQPEVVFPPIPFGPPPFTTTLPSSNLAELLKSDEWPVAVDPSLIIGSDAEQDKIDRADGILDIIIDIHLENLRFLDYGCGEGYVINKSKSQKPKMAMGYDVAKSAKWDTWVKAPNMTFTDDWNEVKQLGPYNVVLMYDVIDHMVLPEGDLIQRLKELKSLLAPNGKIYIRCHPWTAKHATHLYYQLNKAYAHIVFTDEELKKMGYKQEEIRKYKHPLEDYKRLFNDAGLRIFSGPITIKENVDTFFKDNLLVRERIQEQLPLEIQWVDYVLM